MQSLPTRKRRDMHVWLTLIPSCSCLGLLMRRHCRRDEAIVCSTLDGSLLAPKARNRVHVLVYMQRHHPLSRKRK
jgi:hypothetical protein